MIIAMGLCVCSLMRVSAQDPAAQPDADTLSLGDSLSTSAVIASLARPTMQQGYVQIFQDSRIGRLLEAYRADHDPAAIPGFRIRIFSAAGNTARQQAQAAMQAFASAYPGVVPYLSYDEPYFKIYVGDFRTKSEALRFQKRIAGKYPNAFISADYIRVVPPEKGTVTPVLSE